MKPNDPYRRKRAAISAALAQDELPAEYTDRAILQLMQDEDEQRAFVLSEFLDRGLIRSAIAGAYSPDMAIAYLRAHFCAWLREHRMYRITTTAWALYAADHPAAPASADAT